MIKPLGVFFICLFAGSLAFADVNMSGVHAFPVPFNPKKSSKRVIEITGFPIAAMPGTIKMEVFDINGDKVVSRTFTFSTGSIVQWNARTENGKLVSPGMYIIKLSLYADDGDFGKKIIRTLIAY